jgi:hypothetical protein
MKIAICLIGNMTTKNRDWNRTNQGLSKKLINCWKEEDTVNVYICSEFIPENMINFYKPKDYIIFHEQIKTKYLILLEKLINEDVDFIICTRPDIVFFNEVSSFDLMFDKFNFLFRETNHWWGKYTCDNLFAFPKKYLIEFHKTITHCPKVKPFCGELHSQIYPCLVDEIGKENIHFIQKEPGFSGSGLNKFYLLDRYHVTPGDLGPTNLDNYQKYLIEGKDYLKWCEEQIKKDTEYLEDAHEHA